MAGRKRHRTDRGQVGSKQRAGKRQVGSRHGAVVQVYGRDRSFQLIFFLVSVTVPVFICHQTIFSRALIDVGEVLKL